MTLQVRQIAFEDAWDELVGSRLGLALPDDELSSFEPDLSQDDVEAVAGALDRMREVCASVGQLTLRAQVAGVAPEDICAALNSVTAAGVRALTKLLDA